MPKLPNIRFHPLEVLDLERERWVLWLPVFFGLGISFYFSFSFEPPFWLGAAGMSLAGILALARLRLKWGPGGIVLAGWVLLGVFAAGFAAAQFRTASVEGPVLTGRVGPTSVTGRVTNVETFPNGSRVTLERSRISGIRADLTPEKIRLRLRGTQPPITVGNWLRLRAILSPPSPPAAPGAFDFQRQSYFRGLGGMGFSLGPAEIISGSPISDSPGAGPGFFTLGLARLRQAVTARVLAGAEGRVGPVAAALMTGERRAIPPEIMDSIRDSGLAHLLAISGLHIGLIAGILFVGLRGLLALIPPLALHYPIKKWAAAFAILGAFAYALIAGATVPSQRAFLMIGLILAAVIVDRRGLTIRLVAWAALIILVVQPESLLGPSFQMSFAAVTALIVAYEAISEKRRFKEYTAGPWPPWVRRMGVYLAGVALTTLIASAATTPFAVYHFNRFADYGLAANLIAVPVTALWVMPWAVVAFGLMPVGLEAVALTPMGWGIEVVISVAETVASWPGAVTLVPAMPIFALAAIALGGVWLCLWRQRWRYLGLAGILAGMAAPLFVQPPDLLIDGQGRLLAVRTETGSVAFSSLRRARFNREMWLRRMGQDRARAKWPVRGTSADQRLSCDLQGCLYRIGNRTVALSFAEGALTEDCWVADVVVSIVPVRRACPAKAVIDRFDLWRRGGHAFWLSETGVRIETVNGSRGNRPWVLKPARKPKRTPGDT